MNPEQFLILVTYLLYRQSATKITISENALGVRPQTHPKIDPSTETAFSLRI
jgi:hypothetical protein